MEPKESEVVGYDLVFDIRFKDIGDCETGPLVKLEYCTVFGFLTEEQTFTVDFDGEEEAFVGVKSRDEAVKIWMSLSEKHPDHDIRLDPITRDDIEFWYYASCLEQEVQV